ncbi:hypothetical protein S40293_07198 [Stachybotrys chartarum IBT 40293]|nr:hypothetical protein S40293_07198 [Stachybotrys chartarum IBT 40293]
MDPLSITASVIAIVGAGDKCITKLRTLHHAPSEILCLMNEIGDLNIVLTQIITLDQQARNTGAESSLAGLRSLFKRAENQVLELDAIVQNGLAKYGALRNGIGWVRYKNQVTELQQSMRSTRLNLTTALGTATLQALVRVEVAIQSISAAPTLDPASLPESACEKPVLSITQTALPGTSTGETTPASSLSAASTAQDAPEAPDFADLQLHSLITNRTASAIRVKTLTNAGQQRCSFPELVPRVHHTRAVAQLFSHGPGTVSPHTQGQSSYYSIMGTSKKWAHGGISAAHSSWNGESTGYFRGWLFISTHLVWDWILGGRLNSQEIVEFMDIFDDDDYLQSRRFTPLHKTVCIPAPEWPPLKTQLQLSTSTINAVDSQGRTCLCWAAARGDIDAVQTLLDFGADATICDSRGWPPLFSAIAYDRVAVTKLLLARTETHLMVATDGTTVLHIAACSDPEILELVIKRGGINVNSVDENGQTPLHIAALWGADENIWLFRDADADLDVPDNRGCTAVHWAIMENNHATAKQLSNTGARFDLFTETHSSVLHFAARHCDLRMLQIMADTPSIQNLDPNDARSGFKWLEYAEYYLKACYLLDNGQVEERMQHLYDFQAQVWGEEEEEEEEDDDDDENDAFEDAFESLQIEP